MPKSLLFIPDISGFTNYVHSTEQNHSTHIISEILEELVDANILGLELAEIEGDALFYFKPDYIPSAKDLIGQTKHMYRAFHTYLKSYEQRRICPCGACENAINLELKFIAHTGDLDFIQVKDIRKPFGEAIIQAHRILKNSVPLNEYLLISQDLWDSMKPEPYGSNETEAWQLGSDELDFGRFEYHFLNLKDWKKKIKASTPIEYHQTNKADIIISEQIDVAPRSLFELVSNLDYRLKWTQGIKEIKHKGNQVNQSGTTHVCVLNTGTINVESFIERRKNSSLVLGEITVDPPLADKVSTLYIVSASEDGKSSILTFEVRVEGSSFLFRILKPLLLSRLRKSIRKNINAISENAALLVGELRLG